jgi:ActR/RegA family two-component response regulator
MTMSSETLSLLILDDDAAIGRLLARLAGRGGWSAEHISTVSEFRARLQARHPQAVMIDLNLGEEDGVEQLRFLHRVGYVGAVVLMSGVDERVLDAAREVGLSLGLSIEGVLGKPASLEEINEMLAGLRLGRAVARASTSNDELDQMFA